MTAGTRMGMAMAAAALVLSAVPSHAQDAPPPPADEAPADTVGPRDLQNFSINGTVTRRADPPATATPRPAPSATPAPSADRPRAAAPATPAPTDNAPATVDARDARADDGAAVPVRDRPSAAERAAITPTPSPALPTVAPTESRTAPASSVTVPLPPIDGSVAGAEGSALAGDDELSPSRGFTAWPWLLVALTLALGGFMLWRNRARPAFAGYDEAPTQHAFVPPQPPAPRPVPTPAPRQPMPAPAPALGGAPVPQPAGAALGIVSTRLRPRLELTFTPLRCVVDDERVAVDFELELHNSGSAPARAVLIEASMFNAGPAQDQAIDGFFANPVGQGERIPVIAPMTRMAIRSQVSAPRANLQLFKVEGREMFVPLIAFNSLYGWSNGQGQSSSAFLVGRDTGAAKLAPLRTDLGSRQYAGLGARALPNEVRS